MKMSSRSQTLYSLMPWGYNLLVTDLEKEEEGDGVSRRTDATKKMRGIGGREEREQRNKMTANKHKRI